MLGKLAWKHKPHRRLNFARGDGRLLVVTTELGGLGGDLLEDVVDKAVHNGHGLRANAGVWMHLLQHLVDIQLVPSSPSWEPSLSWASPQLWARLPRPSRAETLSPPWGSSVPSLTTRIKGDAIRYERGRGSAILRHSLQI
ncbi:hypothetical protein Vafri_8443 [Volvox africanus]|nr:hypothetical protein Vafri_8443 [Volvox africanus]